MEVTGKGDDSVEQPKSEPAYSVTLRTPLAEYFANSLLTTHRQELLGNRNQPDSEDTRRVVDLAERLRPKTQGASQVQPVVSVSLAESDINTIRKRLQLPKDYAEGKAHTLMVQELTENFQSAKHRAK